MFFYCARSSQSNLAADDRQRVDDFRILIVLAIIAHAEMIGGINIVPHRVPRSDSTPSARPLGAYVSHELRLQLPRICELVFLLRYSVVHKSQTGTSITFIILFSLVAFPHPPLYSIHRPILVSLCIWRDLKTHCCPGTPKARGTTRTWSTSTGLLGLVPQTLASSRQPSH